MRIKQAYCSSALAHKLALEGEEEKRERERKRSGERGRPGLLSPEISRAGGGRLWGAGASSEGPHPAEAAEEEEEGSQAALLWWRRVPEDTETLEAVRRVRGGQGWGGKAEQQGRQRRHTRLYPVEISRALKSSESMLPVCFCSRTQGQQRRPGPE